MESASVQVAKNSTCAPRELHKAATGKLYTSIFALFIHKIIPGPRDSGKGTSGGD
jgi:hypothetical protein